MSDRLVERMRHRLESGTWPRLHCALLIALATAAAFLVSVLLLAFHVHSMALRYGLAALGGYVTFVLLIRAWVRWKSQQFVDGAEDPGPLADVVANLPYDLPSRGGSAARSAFSGGRSGGGGAAGTWGTPATASASPKSSGGGGISLDLDADDLLWLLVALAAILAGVTAIAYVVWIAPTLLAEVAVNAAVAGKVYHGMKKRDLHHWTTQVVRRTAVAALVLTISAVVAGYALQRVAPEARSIGGVWTHLRR